MKKTTCKNGTCCLPLWAKILLGILGGVVLIIGLLIALNIATFESLKLQEIRTTTEPETGNQQISGSDLSSLPSTMNTEKAVKNYLENSNKAIQEDQIVASGDSITVDYIGRLDEKEVFDTSVKAIAEAAGILNPGRNYEEGLSFVVGAGQMISGFDQAVVGMKVGETKTITIPSTEAYGPAEMEFPAPKEELAQIWGSGEFVVGETKIFNDMSVEILAIDGDTITVKMPNPHPLAGKDLIFDITIKTIAEA